jgi:thymidylate synthase (FAD)
MSEVKLLDHGFVALVDTMGTDRTPAQTARTSFRNRKERTPEEDAKLTSYLVRNRHTTPLEFCQLLFYMKMPIFVARQLVRHRTASINEVSYRYVQAAREFYVPAHERMQKKSESNKQGSSFEIVDRPDLCAQIVTNSGNRCFDDYEQLLEYGLAPELARSVLPVGTYTEWYWQSDLHNVLHMLRLRLDPHAQYEIRVYAQAMLDLVRPLYPSIIAAWESTLPDTLAADIKRRYRVAAFAAANDNDGSGE